MHNYGSREIKSVLRQKRIKQCIMVTCFRVFPSFAVLSDLALVPPDIVDSSKEIRGGCFFLPRIARYTPIQLVLDYEYHKQCGII